MRSRGIAVAAIGFFLASAAAADSRTLVLDPADPGGAPAVRVLAERGDALVLAVTLPALTVDDLEVERLRWQALSIAGGSYRGEAGQAGLPTLPRLVQVPDGAAVTARVLSAETERYSGYRLLPIQPEGAESFVVDRDYYARPAPDAPPLVEAGPPAIMGGLRVAPLVFNPVAYDPVRGEIAVARRIEVELDFSGADTRNPAPARPRPVTASFDRLYRDAVVNYRGGDVAAGPGTYLAVCPDDPAVIASLAPLLDWRRCQGYAVRLATLAETGATADSLTAHIQGIYDTADPPLEFISLVGDANGPVAVPCHYEQLTGWNGEGDHYYATLEGDDYLADAHVGRISVRSADELAMVVDKILDYETDPPMNDTSWFTRAALIGDPTSSGMTCVYVNQWVKEQLLDHGYTRVDTIWAGNFSGFAYQHINAGVTAFGYRGFWYVSGITVGLIQSLTNGDRLCFALFPTCGTNSFAEDITARTEAFLRNPNGGGVGAAALATIGTETRPNNIYYQGVWQGAINLGDYRLGVANTRGKTQLFIELGGHQDHIAEGWAVWASLIGDPATELWTGVPAVLVAHHPWSLPAGASSVPATVTQGGAPCEGVLVTLWKDDEVSASALTDAAGRVNLSLAGATPGAVHLTARKHNHLPYRGEVTLGAAGAYLGVADTEVDDDDLGGSAGNGDGVLEPGETIELRLALANLGTSPLAGVTATLSTNDPQVTITDNTEDFGAIDAGATAWCLEDFDLVVDPAAPDGHRIDLNVQATAGADSWTSLAQLTVSAPALAADSIAWSGGGGELDPGESGVLVLRLRNLGSRAATEIAATLLCEDPWVTVTDPDAAYGDLPPGAAGTGDAFGLALSPESFAGRPVSVRLAIGYNGGARDTVDLSLPVGGAGTTDPLGPDDYGTFCFDNTDVRSGFAPVFDWVEIDPRYGGAGTAVGLSDYGFEQDDTRILSLPFVFPYYGRDYTQISICSNGWAALGATNQRGCWNYRLPSATGPDAMIAPYWDDLHQEGQNLVYHWHDSANHRYVVQWSRVLDADDRVQNFQLILYDPLHHPTPMGDGDIVFQYDTVHNNDTHVRFATTGIQDADRDDGLCYTYYNDYPPAAPPLGTGRALRFLRPIPGPLGILAGTVTNLTDGGPGAGVTIRLLESGAAFTSNAAGGYEGGVTPDLYTLRAEHPSIDPVTVENVVVTESGTVTVDIGVTDIQPPAIADVTELGVTADTTGPYVVEMTVTDFSGLADLRLHWTTNGAGPFAADMAPTGDPDRYRAEIPGQPLGMRVCYWLTARDAGGLVARDPADESAFHEFWILTEGVIFGDDFEIDRGWTVGDPADTATEGLWVREDPVAVWYNGQEVQPGDDATPDGSLCWVTGNDPAGSHGVDDVDGGRTTLVSPVFDLSRATGVTVSYKRWYSNDTGYAPGTDNWLVQVTSDGISWRVLEFSTASERSWLLKSAFLDDISDLTDQVRFRFIASDYNPDGVVEAALDDFTLYGYQLPDMTGAADESPPAMVTLLGAVPNPFNPATAIRFGLPAAGPVTLRIFDVNGRLVRTLAAARPFAAGVHAVSWDGRDEAGRPASSGIYLYRLEAGGIRLAGKAVLLK
ncbi:MAG: carboxypeptidase regulatory-like domain-containing protein [Candidatus Krumholzibacteriota bacterium]|nr:carboxypeptidase regulatory-like domain-containing protein [Candidatus Krumholzibacteriota bacterium]